MSINEAIEQLKNYQGPAKLTLHPGADEALLESAESTYGVVLPDDFKALYRFSDGLEIDEDIFNMIPLTEIISNYENISGEFVIAEYMIYSEHWKIRVNPSDPNDYIITANGYNGDTITLTKSLAEFVTRFLKGGVFEEGGLYHWREEIRANLPITPEKIAHLLSVYYYCLRYGIITRREIIEWADDIIKKDEEPNYLFIEISLSHDMNALISLLDSARAKDSALITRVMLALLYHRLSNKALTEDKAVSVIYKLNTSALTEAERSKIYNHIYTLWHEDKLENDGPPDEIMMTFLARYKEFTLSDYYLWKQINNSIEFSFKERETSNKTQNRKTRPVTKFERVVTLIAIIAFGLVIIGGLFWIFPGSSITLELVLTYFLVKIALGYWKKGK